MIVYVLFVHKNMFQREKFVLFSYKIKNEKKTKKQKNNNFSGFLGGFLGVFWGFFGWFFLGGFLIANPACSASRLPKCQVAARRRLVVVSRCWPSTTSISGADPGERPVNLFRRMELMLRKVRPWSVGPPECRP